MPQEAQNDQTQNDQTTQNDGIDVPPDLTTDPRIQKFIQESINHGLKESRSRINEFRDTTTKVRAEVDRWNSLGDYDEVQQIMGAVKKSKETEMIAKGQLDEVLSLRIEPIKKSYERQLADATAKLDTLSDQNAKLESANYDLQVGNQIALAASSIQDLHQGSVKYLIESARKVWLRQEDGTIAPFMANGVRWKGRDGKADITFREWIETFRDSDESFLFKAPAGLTARGGSGLGSATKYDGLTGDQKIQLYHEEQYAKRTSANR